MPTIRIDGEVYSWLKSLAIPFQDTPNSVLRRLARLDETKAVEKKSSGLGNSEEGEVQQEMETTEVTDIRGRQLRGKELSRLWGVKAEHALYHKDGTFYENLHRFPGALFDRNGYVRFETEHEYRQCPYLNIGKKLNVRHGIASIPGYKHIR
jgi:hypothetical protein